MTLPPVSQFDDLLEAYKGGNSEAFEKFFRQSRDSVYNYALHRLKNPEKAAEVTQETFLRVHRYILSFNKEDGLAIGWVFGIAKNCVADYLRDQQLELAHGAESRQTNLETLKLNDRSFFYDLLQSLERELPQEDVDLLLERVIMELSFEEIAEKRGIQSANARQRFSRIIRKIREIF